MTTVFIRGTFAICPCGAELNVRGDIVAMGPAADGARYQSICRRCGRQTFTDVSQDTVRQAAAFLKQVVVDKDQTDNIIEPLNEDEQNLLEFHNRLDQMTDSELWVALIGG